MNSNAKYMNEAIETSKLSDDPSTKVGCVIVKNNDIVSRGFNHWPEQWKGEKIWARGSGEGEDLDSKYPYVIHSEADAISKAATDLHGATIYVTLFPCNNCAKCMISAGISKVVYISDKYANLNAFKASRRLLNECGVELVEYHE